MDVAGSFLRFWKKKGYRYFSCGAVLLLLLTGISKAATLWYQNSLLDIIDPLFGVTYRYVLPPVGILEIALAIGCLLYPKSLKVMTVLFAFSLSVLLYRLFWALSPDPFSCPCLGGAFKALPIDAALMDRAMLLMAFLLLGGSLLGMRTAQLHE